MSKPVSVIRHLSTTEVPRLRELNTLFGSAFEDSATYNGDPPSDAYLTELLGKPHVVALVALVDGAVAGGLIAYELDKFERARSEMYIYDLAVEDRYRRKGIATALIQELGAIAARRGAWVVYVQADYGDDPAIALYEKLGIREEVLHFDIAVQPATC